MKITPLMWKNFKMSLAYDVENQEKYGFTEDNIHDGSIRNIVIHLLELRLLKELEYELQPYENGGLKISNIQFSHNYQKVTELLKERL